MKLKNFLLFLPAAFISTIAKTKRDDIDESLAGYIQSNGLYHITGSQDTANKIIESGYIKANKSVINSYGSPVACMFAGIPELDNYIKNIATPLNNVVTDPTMVLHAIKINTDQDQLKNYKVRSLNDDTILHKGNCNIDKENVEYVQLVLDLIKDKEGKISIGFRERTKEEIASDKDYVERQDGSRMYIPNKIVRHEPSRELLNQLDKYKMENGYAKRNIIGFKNALNTVLHQGEIENKNTIQGVKKYFQRIFSNKNSREQLIQEPNDQITDAISGIQNGSIDTLKSIGDKKYMDAIYEYDKSGIKQEQISDFLPKLCKSKECDYLREKVDSIDMSNIKKKGIHGKSHADKVALLSTAIQSKEGINLDERMQDILVTASYYHDIGRILDSGPHAKRSAKKVDKINLTHLSGEQYSKEDVNILKSVIIAHEGKDEYSYSLIDKNGIDEKDKEGTRQIITILKDADALDRARFNTKNKAGLNPEYLRTNAAKGLVDFSTELETLYSRIGNFKNIISYTPRVKDKEEISMISELRKNVETKDNYKISSKTHTKETPELKI